MPSSPVMLRVVLYQPEIPQNTGNLIRIAANTGAELHLVEPLGFSLDESRVRRAGLDYHELAVVAVHPHIDAAWEALAPRRVFALTTMATARYSDMSYQPDDVLLFGPESVGLPAEVLDSDRITSWVRIPMMPRARSMNLANAASVTIYEAWRQLGFPGAT